MHAGDGELSGDAKRHVSRANWLRQLAGMGTASLLPASSTARTLQSICMDLDSSRVHHTGRRLFEITVGPPGLDSWSPVTVRASLFGLEEWSGDSIEYVWLKDASSSTSRRVYAARKAPSGSAELQLTQALKSGYRARPMVYCRNGGLYEGDLFVVP